MSKPTYKTIDYLSSMNMIMFVFSVEYIIEDTKGKRFHVTERAIANNGLEVQALVRTDVHKKGNRFICFLAEPTLMGKDKTWLAAGKAANNKGPRLTDEVVYAQNGICATSA